LDIKGDLSVAKHPTDATSYATRGGILSDSYLSTFKDAEEHPKDAPRVTAFGGYDQRSAFKMCKGVKQCLIFIFGRCNI